MRYNRLVVATALAGALASAPVAAEVNLPIKSSGDYSSPESVPGAQSVDTERAHSLWLNHAYFLDPRSDSDFESGRIPGAIHIKYDPGKPNQELTPETLEAVVPKNAPLVVYCNDEGCDRSSWAAALAADWGWTSVYYYRDGYPVWTQYNYPSE